MTLIRTIDLDYDIVEVHYNPNLSHKPYLIKVFSYHNSDPTELRLDEDEIKNLYTVLKQHNLL